MRWPERDLLALSPLVRLLWGTIIDELVAGFDRRGGLHCNPVLLLIDEAGRTAIPTLADHSTTVVGRGISLWIAVQSLSQLDAVYGRVRAQVLRRHSAGTNAPVSGGSGKAGLWLMSVRSSSKHQDSVIELSMTRRTPAFVDQSWISSPPKVTPLLPVPPSSTTSSTRPFKRGPASLGGGRACRVREPQDVHKTVGHFAVTIRRGPSSARRFDVA
jgi:hypothetical protein